jgi:hypothetical protein
MDGKRFFDICVECHAVSRDAVVVVIMFRLLRETSPAASQ